MNVQQNSDQDIDLDGSVGNSSISEEEMNEMTNTTENIKEHESKQIPSLLNTPSKIDYSKTDNIKSDT